MNSMNYNLSKNLVVLAPKDSPDGLGQFLSRKDDNVCQPFDNERIRILNALSHAIRRAPQLRSDGGAIALSFWLRTSNLERIKRRFEQIESHEKEATLVPAGRVFHITPSNVDTMFIYSWALSFACGNSNIVRISSNRNPVVNALISSIFGLMESEELLRKQNRFIAYPHDKSTTEALSRWCTHRTVWGGNETAAAIRPTFLDPHASERIFASKFSYSVIQAQFLGEASEEVTSKVGDAFFNDVFSFDQMACSSPHIIFWVGDEVKARMAMTRFNEALQKAATRRNLEVTPSSAMQRLTEAFKRACESNTKVDLEHPAFVSVECAEKAVLDRDVSGKGLLRHVFVASLDQVGKFADRMDQTITHFGFSSEQLKNLAKVVGCRGVDRLVPIGEGLSFEHIWDGFDLLRDFTRTVVVREGKQYV